jgi:hypothetical protein
LQLKDLEGQSMQKNKKKGEKSTLEIINKVYESENNNVQQKIKKMRDL